MSLKLVPYSEEVFNKLFEWQNDDEMRKTMGGLSIPLKEEEMFHQYNQFLNGNSAVLGVATEEGTIIGAFIMEQVQPRHKRLHTHIVFEPDYFRHVKEGCKLFLDYIFNENNFEYLHCIVAASQKNTLNLIKKIGFRETCIVKNYFNFADGWVSGHFYHLTKTKRKV